MQREEDEDDEVPVEGLLRGISFGARWQDINETPSPNARLVLRPTS